MAERLVLGALSSVSGDPGLPLAVPASLCGTDGADNRHPHPGASVSLSAGWASVSPSSPYPLPEPRQPSGA